MIQNQNTHLNNYLVKQLPFAMVFLNTQMKIVYRSDKFLNDFDIDRNNNIGENFFKIFPYFTKTCKEVIKKSLTGEKFKVKKEYCFNQKENYKWIEWISNPWYDENENIIGITLNIENITEKIAQELQQKKLDVLLKETTEVGKIGTWEYDIKKDRLSWCDMTKKIHDVPMTYEPNIRDAILFYKEGRSRNTIKKVVDNALKNGSSWSNKLQIITLKNKEKWVIASGKPIYRNEELVGLFGTFNNINEHELSEIKTKESENLLRTLIDHLPLNVFIKDLESKKILSNKYDMDYCGSVIENDVIGKDDFYYFEEDVAKKMRKEDLKVMQTNTPLLGKESYVVKKDGTKNTLLVYKIPLRENNGKVKGLVGFSLDISSLKEKEKELKRLIDITSSQNEKLINFAHITSHNLRSHTANFSMLLDFLVDEKNQEEKNNIIKMLTNTSNKLLETLSVLNNVVNINTHVNLEKKSTKINVTIKTAEQNLAILFKKNNVKIINTISDEICVKAIPSYLENIITNVISNAIRYKSPQREPLIKIYARQDEDYTIISVEDNGIGIDLKKYGDKLFGMYKTFHDNADAKGIGLYIAKNQIEAMNGKLTATSVLGKGSIFNIYFNEKN